MKSLELLDSWISRKIRDASSRFAGGQSSPELLEIRRELLEDVRSQIQPAGNGRLIFPYRTVHILLGAANQARRELLEGAFAQDDLLQQDVVSLLSEAGCTPPDSFRVEATVLEDEALAASKRPFRVEYSNQGLAELPAPPAARRAAILTVVQGDADPSCFRMDAADRAHLGRLREVNSDSGSLRRRNDIAFAETEKTVSREHAYITFDPESCNYRLHDARNQRGTSIFRNSRQLRVPKGASNGVILKSGDEIHLGNARIRFELEE